jgi:hypothetical protein
MKYLPREPERLEVRYAHDIEENDQSEDEHCVEK